MATQNKSLATPANGSNVGVWDVPVNANWNAIDSALGGTAVINAVGAAGVVVLTSAQYTPPAIVISGAITDNIVYEFPATVGWFGAVFNATSGAFNIAITSAGGGTGVVVPQGSSLVLACDGTNVRQASANALPGGSDTQVQFNSAGAFAGSANLTWNNSTSVLDVVGVVTVGTTGINVGFGVATGIVGDGTNIAVRYPTGGTFSVQTQAGAATRFQITDTGATFSIPVSSASFIGALTGNASSATAAGSATTSGTAAAGSAGFTINTQTAMRVAAGSQTNSGLVTTLTGVPGTLNVGEIVLVVAAD